MLYGSVNLQSFISSFKSAGRDVFSYQGYKALFEYLDEQDELIEFFVVDLNCCYVELSYEEVKQDYNLDKEYTKEDIINYLSANTFIVYIGLDSVLFEVF